MSALAAKEALVSFSKIPTGVGAPAYSSANQSFQNRSSLAQPLEGKMTNPTNGTNRRTILPQNRKETPRRDGKDENRDWLGAQLSLRSVQEVSDATGMTDKAVQNIRRRKSAISFDNLVDLCRQDHVFAAAFAEYVGLILPGEAEFAGALTQAFTAWERRRT